VLTIDQLKTANQELFTSALTPKAAVRLELPKKAANIRAASTHLVSNMKDRRDRICFLDKDVEIDSLEKVYVVFVAF